MDVMKLAANDKIISTLVEHVKREDDEIDEVLKQEPSRLVRIALVCYKLGLMFFLGTAICLGIVYLLVSLLSSALQHEAVAAVATVLVNHIVDLATLQEKTMSNTTCVPDMSNCSKIN